MFKLLTFIVLIALLYNLVTGRPIMPPKNKKPSQRNNINQEDDDYDDYQEID